MSSAGPKAAISGWLLAKNYFIKCLGPLPSRERGILSKYQALLRALSFYPRFKRRFPLRTIFLLALASALWPWAGWAQTASSAPKKIFPPLFLKPTDKTPSKALTSPAVPDKGRDGSPLDADKAITEPPAGIMARLSGPELFETLKGAKKKKPGSTRFIGITPVIGAIAMSRMRKETIGTAGVTARISSGCCFGGTITGGMTTLPAIGFITAAAVGAGPAFKPPINSKS